MSAIGYVTLEEADAYVASHFLSTDKVRVAWDVLIDSDRTALLNRSFSAIELLHFTGRRYADDQTTAFPRFPYSTVPQAIKDAQVENAVAFLDSDTLDTYNTLWHYGVESYSIGNLSETSKNGQWGHSGAAMSSDLPSTKAMDLLRPYLSGGYRI